MKHTLADNELIELFMLGKLSEKEIRAFQERRAKDREFRRKCNLIRTFPEMMSEEGRREFEKKQAEKVALESEKRSGGLPKKYRIIAWAAVSVLIIAGVVLFFIFKRDSQQVENTADKEIPASKGNVAQPLALPVKDTQAVISIKQEQPAEQAPREIGSGNLSGAIGLLKPAEGKEFSRKEAIRFTWTMKTDSFTRFYIVSRNSEKVVLWRGIKPGVREYEVPGNYLYPGKFYWYVGTREQMQTFSISE